MVYGIRCIETYLSAKFEYIKIYNIYECFLYQVNTKHIKVKRLVLHMLNTDYEYIDCVKRGRNPKYETKTIHGYAEAFINLIEAPIVVNGKVI